MKIKTAYFEITNRCNLNCATCYNRSGLNRELAEISKEQLLRFIETLLPLGLHRVLISGGEPTLHSQFEDVLDIIGEYPAMSFGIVTNGTIHNQKLINILNSRDNITVQISLDGSCEEINALTRGSGNFEKALDFVRKMKNPGMKPLLKMVISQNNYSDVENFYRLAISEGCIPEYAFIYRSGNGSDGWEQKLITPKQKLTAIQLINRLNREYETKAFLPFCTSRCPYIKSAEEMSVCVKVDGSVQPCQAMYDSIYSLGNLFDFDMDSFTMRTEDFRTLAGKRTEIDYGCSKCFLRETCGRGCMAAAFILYGDPLAEDGECAYRKAKFMGYNLNKTLVFDEVNRRS